MSSSIDIKCFDGCSHACRRSRCRSQIREGLCQDQQNRWVSVWERRVAKNCQPRIVRGLPPVTPVISMVIYLTFVEHPSLSREATRTPARPSARCQACDGCVCVCLFCEKVSGLVHRSLPLSFQKGSSMDSHLGVPSQTKPRTMGGGFLGFPPLFLRPYPPIKRDRNPP